MEVVATVASVTSRETKKGYKIYDVVADGQTYSTFSEQVAKAALPFVKKEALIKFDVEKKGEFTNVKLLDVSAATEGGIREVVENTDTVEIPSEQGSRDRRIHRQTAVKAASVYAASAGLDEVTLFRLAEDMVTYFENGTFPGQEAEVVPILAGQE